ncbi:MAG: PD40 domain-containing protein, partial [Candidatus Krumholzibacteria bacterium]|nr:PD40 domain-containing protein [Candidatus Krumholzibacteria bacterium]
ICEFGRGADAVWGSDGVILFDGSSGDSIQAVAAGGGAPSGATLIDRSRGEDGHGWPFFLPDGKRFLYISFRRDEPAEIRLGSLGSFDTEKLTEGDSRIEYVAPNYLIFERNRTLLAQPFDPGVGKLAGDPFPLTEGIGTGAVGLAHFSGSSNGTLIYTSGDSPERQMAWFDRQGRELSIVGVPARLYDPALSADGRRVAVEIVDPRTDAADIWLIDLRRGARSRFTFDAADDERPVFSPDGSQIAFASNRDGDFDVFAKNTGGAGEATKVMDTDFRTYPTFWLPGGNRMVGHGARPETGWDVISWDGDSPGDSVEAQIASRFVDGWPRVAPGGNYMSYVSNESGRFEVYLSTFPAGRSKWQISLSGGSDPQWRADGTELFFLTL